MSDGRLTTKAAYGKHIDLYCVNHPEKRWSTKNIGSIGSRNIYYNLGCVQGVGPECSCPGSDLRVVDIDGPEVPE